MTLFQEYKIDLLFNKLKGNNRIVTIDISLAFRGKQGHITLNLGVGGNMASPQRGTLAIFVDVVGNY